MSAHLILRWIVSESWAKNDLQNSDLAKQLAISTILTDYVIGSDGKLVASINERSEVHPSLRHSLHEDQVTFTR